MEDKIRLEKRMREGTAKLLAASSGPIQSLEIEKSLLVSSHRMKLYAKHLQHQNITNNHAFSGNRYKLLIQNDIMQMKQNDEGRKGKHKSEEIL